MERHFDEEMKEVKEQLLRMADIAQQMVGASIRGLADRKEDVCRSVFESEEKVNRIEIEIEEKVIGLIALRQPAAKDLRFLTAVLKINNDLERVADQAVNIAELALDLLKAPQLKPLIDIPHMAALAQQMIKDSLDAFVRHEPVLAKEVCGHDDPVDRLNDQIFRELLTYMMQDPKSIERAVDLILVSRNLERIADHATNIAEEIIFIEEGKNIKHQGAA